VLKIYSGWSCFYIKVIDVNSDVASLQHVVLDDASVVYAPSIFLLDPEYEGYICFRNIVQNHKVQQPRKIISIKE
jgi:hypothetical protein